MKLRPEILASPVYRQGRAAGADAFKLSSNENPFPPLPAVLAAITAELEINRYPDATAAALRGTLAARLGTTADEVIIGSGSVALLQQFILAAAGPGDEVAYSWRSFEAYPTMVTVAGATSVPVPNRADGGHDLPALADAITPRTRVVIVCSPNNPTGVTVTAEEFTAFMETVPSDLLVLLDEAYAEFVREPEAVDGRELIGRYPNLVILRTFSKAYGLAGLRVGWATGPEAILDAARATAIPLSVTGLAQVAAEASLEAEAELLERVEKITVRRTAFIDALRAQGWNIPASESNFIWLALGDHTLRAAERFFDAGLVTRPFAGDGVRISIGEEESLTPLLTVAQEILTELPTGHPARA
ncbi:aminotransferase class I/II-fold pyridoxal phosphate-dependent enzyme [Mycetocola tolaasinivorans]|uniref:Aromatic amino acid aminotransferase n=1 Tax=Mycetocola tolaasinivorans TaxID=76635 RepID=A0A3L7A4L4_9MICO|nr:histidinol-phosphate transaminase [Mycetocola tolaasinivorans]RLP75266.1 aminotransferase class I/II-fold pyridoxal phosphate-dependent enzyme [Mycetocola tolaasinivorans]